MLSPCGFYSSLEELNGGEDIAIPILGTLGFLLNVLMTLLKLQKDFIWGGLDDLPLEVGMYKIKYTLFIKNNCIYSYSENFKHGPSYLVLYILKVNELCSHHCP